MTDQFFGSVTFWRLYPGDFPDDRERVLGGMEGDLESCAGSQRLGEAEQESTPTDISCPTVDELPPPILWTACDGDVQWPPDPGMAHRTLRAGLFRSCERRRMGSRRSQS